MGVLGFVTLYVLTAWGQVNRAQHGRVYIEFFIDTDSVKRCMGPGRAGGLVASDRVPWKFTQEYQSSLAAGSREEGGVNDGSV